MDRTDDGKKYFKEVKMLVAEKLVLCIFKN